MFFPSPIPFSKFFPVRTFVSSIVLPIARQNSHARSFTALARHARRTSAALSPSELLRRQRHRTPLRTRAHESLAPAPAPLASSRRRTTRAGLPRRLARLTRSATFSRASSAQESSEFRRSLRSLFRVVLALAILVTLLGSASRSARHTLRTRSHLRGE